MNEWMNEWMNAWMSKWVHNWALTPQRVSQCVSKCLIQWLKSTQYIISLADYTLSGTANNWNDYTMNNILLFELYNKRFPGRKNPRPLSIDLSRTNWKKCRTNSSDFRVKQIESAKLSWFQIVRIGLLNSILSNYLNLTLSRIYSR